MLETYQTTVKAPVKCTGVGVHSGAPATLTIHPAPANNGIVFRRIDITDRDNLIPARWDLVTDTRLCTVLMNASKVSVSTVEHVLSAIAALGIDNAMIDIDGPEIPIMDGSAASFVFMLECAEKEYLNAPKKAIVVKKPVSFIDGDKEAHLSPATAPIYSFEISFDNAVIGYQKYAFEMSERAYVSEISRARTFGFLHEVEALRKAGLARGGSLENAIVIDQDKILNAGGLRYKNEFVRHKILDAIGDIFLAGHMIIGHFHGIKAGHMMNNRVLHALFADPSAYEVIEMTTDRGSVTEKRRAGASNLQAAAV